MIAGTPDTPDYEERAAELAQQLKALLELQKSLAKGQPDPAGLHAALTTMHAALGAWLDTPVVARMLDTALAVLIHAAENELPTRAAIRNALNFIRRHAPDLPIREQRMLGIYVRELKRAPEVTAQGLPVRTPGLALAQTGGPRRTDEDGADDYEPPSVEVLKRTTILLRALPSSA